MNDWFLTPGYEPSTAQFDEIEACFAANPLDMNVDPTCDSLGKGNGWCFLGEGERPTSLFARLPSGYVTDHGLLHWRWDAWKSANEVYSQCSDIKVTSLHPTMPPPPPAPTTPPPTQPPTVPPPTAPPTQAPPCAQRFESCGGGVQCCANSGFCQSNGICQ
jgi:hypothetical protein